MELGSCMRTDADTIGTPSKRVRGINGFHVPEAVECASKAGRRETPVRKRITVDGVSPPSHTLILKCVCCVSFGNREGDRADTS